MAKTKSKAETKPAKKSASKAEFFKTRKTREAAPKEGDTVTPPEDIMRAIDSFRDAQEQAKHFEGEMTVQKDAINEYSRKEFVKRIQKGKKSSFKLLGEQSMVTYVVMDASAGLTEDEVEAFRERWGDEATDELIMRDLASIRFDGEVFEENYEAITEALSSLPKDVLESLFKPMLQKARPGAVDIAKKHAKSTEDLLELIQQLKIRNYIR